MDKRQLEKRKKIVYEFICDSLYVPMKMKELAVILSVPKERRAELEEAVEALLKEGKIERSKRGRVSKMESHALAGVFCSHPRGFGFVSVEGDEEDIFISSDNVNGALHQDTVQVELLTKSSGRRKEGKIVNILSRGITQIVGTYQSNGNYGFVTPDNPKFGRDIFIQKERSKGAVNGHKVIVKITDYGKKGRNPEGKIIEIIGHAGDPEADVLALVKSYEIPVEFPVKTMNQAERADREVSEADMAGRKDFRAWQTVTIDGEDAKDLDDAVTLTKEGDLYCLGVHIADVANYVQERSALDAEAYKRGTSVYLADRVIPMLPHALSNGICSLNQGEDRLSMSCLMKIDGKGKVVDHEITESVICVDRRMSYTNVNKILEDKDTQLMEEYREFLPMFEQMRELSSLLRQKRKKRGSIDFDFPETKIVLDEKGQLKEIKPYERNTATKLIEDFMLIANETVAEDFYWRQMPFLYRAHEKPDSEKIQKLSAFINNFGYTLHMGQEEIHSKELQKLLGKIEGAPEEALISRLTLRSMKQAKYSADCLGHFGLAASYYCHFTSPIRRYPDLQIHRIIKDCLRGRMNQSRIEHYEKLLPETAKHTSEMERRADEAEREVEKLKKAEYMKKHIGEEFEGIISSITSWGFYVELANTIEGMVHITSLTDDYYIYLEETYELMGEATNRRFKLGQKVSVVAVKADTLLRTIDFELAE